MLERAVVGIETVGLQHRDPTGSLALGLGGRLAGTLVDRLGVSQTFGNVMLYIVSYSGEPGLTRSGWSNRVMTKMSAKEPTIAAKVSPSRNFMTCPVPPPGEHAVRSVTTSCQKAHREESRKIKLCLRFGRNHLRAARLCAGCDLTSSQASRSKPARLTCSSRADRPRP